MTEAKGDGTVLGAAQRLLSKAAPQLASAEAKRVMEILPGRLWTELIVDRFKLWRVRAIGMEVTQSIQFYNAAQHLTQTSDHGPDNSVRLVAGKTAWVRVYVRSGLFSSVLGVTGKLKVQRQILGFLWVTVGTLDPLPPRSVHARSFLDYATERSNTAYTLNFVVPADVLVGNLRMTVTLTGSRGQAYDTRIVHVDATLRQTLRLRGIMVSYNGPSTANTIAGQPPPPVLNLAAPTLGNLQATASRALRAMPVEAVGFFTSAGTLAWNLPLDDPRLNAGGCSTNWNLLLNALTTQRTNDGNRADVVYYGLLPAGIPLNVPGCGVGGLGSAMVGDQATLLHEIGHGYGFRHTPCGAAGATDPNYPTYEPYPSASTGEYGLDIANGNILPPAATRDYMSYCFPQWMSLYHHSRLIQHPRLDPRWDRDEPWWHEYLEWKDYIIPEYIPDPPPDPWKWARVRPQQVISLTGIVHPNSRIEVLNVARVEAATQVDGSATDMTVRLLGSSGDVLAEAPLVRLTSHGGCGCGCDGEDGRGSYLFQALLPNPELGSALTIDRSGEEMWRRTAGAEPPSIRGIYAATDDEGTVRVRWEAQAEEHPEFWIQWSEDGGRSWNSAATGITESEFRLVPGSLPSGVISLRVLAHDGFTTALSEPVSVTLPERMPEVTVLHPNQGQTFVVRQALLLSAAVSGPGVAAAPRFVWLLDGKEVADANEAWIAAPPAGEHRLGVILRHDLGESEQFVDFSTIDVLPSEDGENDERPEATA